MNCFKWAYNAETGELDVWEVSGPQPYASPQHGEHLSTEQYATYYQGRVVLDSDGQPESFTFYPDRPFMNRTDSDAEAARTAIKEWIENWSNDDNSV